jgi:heat-inducible transcriptional repressor
MLTERKSNLFNTIIQEHIKIAHPIGSETVVDKYKFDISPATIRNEMMELEKEGFLYQPYTSAGRVPTEKGWRFYLDNFLKEAKIKKKDQEILAKLLSFGQKSSEEVLKSLAKGLAELSKESVIVGFSPENIYYTGLTHLFSKPEFSKLDLVCHLSEVVDHLDEVINKLFDKIDFKTKVLIGKENPFGEECGVILTKYKIKNENEGMLGILGPIRQHYQNNIALLKYSQELLSKV